MYYKQPFVLYLNLIVILFFFILILTVLFNKRENIKLRLSFAYTFFTVIGACISNLINFYFENYHLIYIQFSFLATSFLFGPAIYFYVKTILNEKLGRYFKINFFVFAIIFSIGLYYATVSESYKKQILQEILLGNNYLYTLLNFIPLLNTIYYLLILKVKLKKIKKNTEVQNSLNLKWANDYTNYFIFNMSLFLVIAIIVNNTNYIKQADLDLILMPVLMLIIYSLFVAKSILRNKEYESLLTVNLLENENKLNEQRLAISRDLHDNIGAYTVSLIAKVEQLQKVNSTTTVDSLDDLHENAQTILSLLRQNIWVLNKQHTTCIDFFDELKNFSKKLFNNLNIQLDFKEDIINNKEIKSSKAIILFRIMQEVFQNIIKHAQSTQVSISIHVYTKINIVITDNGKGFDVNNTTMGNGINNMNYRATEENFAIKITSILNQGTTVEITEI